MTPPTAHSPLPFLAGVNRTRRPQRGARTAPIQPSPRVRVRRGHLRAGNLRCGRTALELARSRERAARGHGPHARRAGDTRCQTGPDSAKDSGDVLG